MVTAAKGTGLDFATMERLKQQFQQEQREAAYLERLRKEQATAGKSGLGRLAQGMKGVGSKLAPVYGAARTMAAPAIQGAAAGVSYGATRAATGTLGKVTGFISDIVLPSDPYDVFVLVAALVYVLDIVRGFNPATTVTTHLYFAAVAFFVLAGVKQKLSIQVALAAGIIFFYMNRFISEGFGSFGIGTAAYWVPFGLALAFYWKADIPPALKGIPMVAAIDIFALNIFRQQILNSMANFGVTAVVGGHLLNRMLNPLFLYYAAARMYNESKAARKVFAIVLFVYVVWGVLSIGSDIAKYHELHPASAEEVAQAKNFLGRFGQNFRDMITLKFFRPSVALAYKKLDETFGGFGEPEEQPKLGLELAHDATMPSEFDFGFIKAKQPEPSFVMKVTSPFPAEMKKPYMEVTQIRCYDGMKKTANLKFESAVTPRGLTPTEDKPIKIFYEGPEGGTEARCKFSGWEGGSYAIAAEADYKVDTSAYMITAFIRADQADALREQSIDPAVANKIPPARAKYKNMPVGLTWGPLEFKNPPVSIDVISQDSAPPNFLIRVYVFKNTGWEDSEIKETKDLTLSVPPGVSLDDLDDSCDFKLKDVALGSNSRIFYSVKEDRIAKITNNEEESRFMGNVIRFDCSMKVSSEALSGADWAPARFDVTGSFTVTTKLKGDITFTVKESESPAAQQQLQQSCTPGQTAGCSITSASQQCPGTKTCSPTGQWGGCEDTFPEDSCPSAASSAGTTGAETTQPGASPTQQQELPPSLPTRAQIT